MTAADQDLDTIQARLDAALEYRPAPHRPVVNTAGDRHGVVDANGCVVTMDAPGSAAFYAAAPTDMAKLLNAVKAVQELHVRHEDSGKCAECTVSPYSMHSVKWPCPTSKALTAALGGTV